MWGCKGMVLWPAKVSLSYERQQLASCGSAVRCHLDYSVPPKNVLVKGGEASFVCVWLPCGE